MNYFKIFDKIPQLTPELEQDCLDSITDDANLSMAGAALGVQGKPVPIYGDHSKLTDASGLPIKGAVYKRYNATERVAQWVQENIHQDIPNDYHIGVQMFEHKFPGEATTSAPHVDGPRGAYVLNYMLKPGGSSVTTEWYIQRGYPLLRLKEHQTGLYLKTFAGLDKVYETTCPVRQWHSLEIRAIHTIANLTEDRVALSVALTAQQWDDVAKRYG